MKRGVVFFCVLLLVVASVAISCVGAQWILKYQKAKIVSLSNEIASLKEEIAFTKFKIISRKAGSMTVDIRFYDLEENLVASTVTPLKGEQLFLDFTVIKNDENSYLFFPVKVFTDQISAELGLDLLELYNHNGYPAIYHQWKLNDRQKHYIGALYEQLRLGKKVFSESFGSAVHDLASIADFQENTVYQVVCHPRQGGVEIIKP